MKLIADIFDAHFKTLEALQTKTSQIIVLGELLIRQLNAGHRLLICGNGGSAADAQHIATELACRYEKWHRPLPALALTTDTSMLTAIGNDLGFDQIFARQVQAHATQGDILLCISTSGDSPNVIHAAEAAQRCGATSVGLLGRDGGKLGKIVDYSLIVPSDTTARIQECHILIGHMWCAMIDQAYC